MNMNKNQASDPVESVIRAAQPEMSRMKEAADVGFETRLRSALEDQSSPRSTVWETAVRRSLPIAAGITALILLQFGFWVASHGWIVSRDEWMLERIFFGI